MSTTLLPEPAAPAGTQTTTAPRTPWHIHAVLFSSLSVVVGVLWDISWHSSIGRDTLWSPPHLAMYLGGVVSGVACGWYVLHTTFGGLPEDRASSVTFWRYFRGPLGAWMCIWGAFAMLTSAPFDDWWHNAYGLDVKILSPPHAVLAMGILAIQLGALFMVLALQNRMDDRAMRGLDSGDSSRFHWMFSVAAGLVLLNFGIVTTEYTFRVYQHTTLFYQIAAGLFVLPLVVAGVAGRMRWSATAAAATYMGVILAMHFILPLFAAEPRLAPVRTPLDRMLPPQFPLLLVVPALAIDLVMQRSRRRGWGGAAILSAAFLLPFFIAQWPFASFLQSELARNALFKQHLRPYMVGPETYGALGMFWEPAAGAELLIGLAIALAIGTVSARLGLAAGRWMTGVRR